MPAPNGAPSASRRRARTPAFAVFAALVALLGAGAPARPAHSAPSHDTCTGFVDALPATITTPGTWCLRQDLAFADASASQALELATNDVTLDCQGRTIAFPGAASDPTGAIRATDRQRVTVRNCTIVGFRYGISLGGNPYLNKGHVVEDNLLTDQRYGAIVVFGRRSVVRRNRIARVGGLAATGDYYGIQVNNGVDVLDNVIEQVAPADPEVKRVTAIQAGGKASYTIAGNRIRGLRAYFDWGVMGIQLSGPRRVLIRGNDFAGEMINAGQPFPSAAVYCFLDDDPLVDVRAGDNVVVGFPDAFHWCPAGTDSGDNDISP